MDFCSAYATLYFCFSFFCFTFAHPLTDMDFFFFFGGGLLGSRFYYAFFNTLHDATNTVLAVLTGFRNPKNVLMCRVVSMRRVSSGFCQCSQSYYTSTRPR